MLVYRTFEELKTFLVAKVESGLTIGFVPTMGALHDGHMSLIHSSMDHADLTICSVFVNPTQFNKAEDLEKYPRTEQADLDILRNNGCDIVLIPSVDEVYPADYSSEKLDLEGIEIIMEGEHRPGHFDGVVQVVGRFFEELQPNFAFFGEKDFQQLAVIRKMVSLRNLPVQVMACAIKREDSGLAMSSRNMRLSEEALVESAYIFKQLNWAKSSYSKQSVDEIKQIVLRGFEKNDRIELEYFEIVNEDTLLPVKNKDEKARAFFAGVVEGVRLIDNVQLY